MYKKSVFITLLVFVLSAVLLMGCAPAQNADVPSAGVQTLAFTDKPAADAEDTAYAVVYRDYHTASIGQEAACSAAVPAEAPAEAPVSTEPAATRCPVCYDDDCDDGIYCDDAHEKAENLREQENRQNGIRCSVCGDYDCDDGAYCDDWDDRYDDHHGRPHDD